MRDRERAIEREREAVEGEGKDLMKKRNRKTERAIIVHRKGQIVQTLVCSCWLFTGDVGTELEDVFLFG